MSDVYEGLATMVVIARYLAQAPIERTTFDCPIRVSDAEPRRTRIELQHYLPGPKASNLLRLTLPDGRMLQGQIIDGCNQPGGGWLLIDVSQCELTLDPSTSLTSWKWE